MHAHQSPLDDHEQKEQQGKIKKKEKHRGRKRPRTTPKKECAVIGFSFFLAQVLPLCRPQATGGRPEVGLHKAATTCTGRPRRTALFSFFFLHSFVARNCFLARLIGDCSACSAFASLPRSKPGASRLGHCRRDFLF
ncbi:hypothetical protein TW95_gp1423 [Pandoravirus inopinatum]|uniref:Uncharacterized protein n=1 Tax=Pandoravirus inopinatum TaxID=1605721 RepID=A0A0B5JEH3_9VIRU|nr:hypothetical protein TW95_gp1423 [Pandoravirus inopinatum]AJF98157.1 hypothetical protein [Pandoravirus inopinatum]